MAATSGDGDPGDPGMPPGESWGPVPDDASALEPDRQAWLAEQRALRRRRRLRRLVFTRRWERFGLSGPLLVLCLALTTAVAGLVVAVVPRSVQARPAPLPLATVPVASVITLPAPATGSAAATGSPSATGAAQATGTTGTGGVIGRRLPDVTLQTAGRPVTATSLRPAVLALVPATCGCAQVAGAIYQQAREFRLDLWLIGPAGSRAEVARLAADGTRGGARWAVDGSGGLAAALAPQGLTLVTVRPDGTVADLGRDLPLDPARLPALEPLLARLTSTNR